jgi:hypothetical protein
MHRNFGSERQYPCLAAWVLDGGLRPSSCASLPSLRCRVGSPATSFYAKRLRWCGTESIKAYCAIVKLSATGNDEVTSWQHLPGQHPNMTLDEWHECDHLLRADPGVAQALARRGITDIDKVLVDVWAYGAALVPPKMTPFADDERWPAGDFPNLSDFDTGLTQWTSADRPIAGTDVVLCGTSSASTTSPVRRTGRQCLPTRYRPGSSHSVSLIATPRWISHRLLTAADDVRCAPTAEVGRDGDVKQHQSNARVPQPKYCRPPKLR